MVALCVIPFVFHTFNYWDDKKEEVTFRYYVSKTSVRNAYRVYWISPFIRSQKIFFENSFGYAYIVILIHSKNVYFECVIVVYQFVFCNISTWIVYCYIIIFIHCSHYNIKLRSCECLTKEKFPLLNQIFTSPIP